MIINLKSEGQLGNSLFHAAQLMILAKESKHIYIDFSFEPYKEFFEELKGKKQLIYPRSKNNVFIKIIASFLKKKRMNIRDFILNRKLNSDFIHYINQDNTDCDDFKSLIDQRKSFKNYLIEGWINTDKTPLQHYRNELKTFFRPLSIHTRNVKDLIFRARNNVDLLVGIHMRRGDYKEYRDGSLYFDDSTYLKHMKNLKEMHSDRSIRFLLASNEPIEVSNFKEVDFILATNHIIEDMYAFSECDYIIGPISTYTMWASFIGEKPLCQLTHKDYVIEKKDFRVINDRSI